MRYGFLDESGDVEYTHGTANHLVVVVVVGHPERLRRAITRTRKTLHKGIRNVPELKAGGDPRVTEALLTHAVEIGFDAVGAVINKNRFPRPRDAEDLYRYACVRAVREALERFGPLTLTVDRRYTKVKLRSRLEQALLSGVQDLGIPLHIRHEDSKKERMLQVADAVAWTLFQKYERGDETFWQMIRGKVIEVKL